ncbi:MAG TPA: tetratricopeptide repeat protein [Chloroflexota bacterium]|nr:tetratricopeptide repeat protein [Chloroflexota bacterium]
MTFRIDRFARRVALPLVALALLVGPLAVAFPGAALAQNTAQDDYNNARNMLQQSDYTGAVQGFTAAINADPSLAEAYVGRATAYMYQGNLDAALQDYNQALQLQPNLPEALYNRGVVLAQRGDSQGAISDLQRAAELFRDRGDQQTADLVSNAINTLQQE